MSDRVEKRKDVRISFHVPLTVQWRSQGSSGSGTVGNMSQSGCYVMTQHPALVGERIFLQPDQNLPELEGLVRHTHEQVGMWIEFVGITAETRGKLADFLRAKAVLWA